MSSGDLRSVLVYTVEYETDKPFLQDNQIGSKCYVKTTGFSYKWLGADTGGWVLDTNPGASAIIDKGPWDPSAGVEYPPDSGDPKIIWRYQVRGMAVEPYTFVAGDLIGQDCDNNDFMVHNGSDWVLVYMQDVDGALVHKGDYTPVPGIQYPPAGSSIGALYEFAVDWTFTTGNLSGEKFYAEQHIYYDGANWQKFDYVPPGEHILPWTTGTAFEKDNILIENQLLYEVQGDYTSSISTAQDLLNGDLLPIGTGGTGGNGISVWTTLTYYTEDTVILDNSLNRLYRVAGDYVSDATIALDIANGDLEPIGPDLSWYVKYMGLFTPTVGTQYPTTTGASKGYVYKYTN